MSATRTEKFRWAQKGAPDGCQWTSPTGPDRLPYSASTRAVSVTDTDPARESQKRTDKQKRTEPETNRQTKTDRAGSLTDRSQGRPIDLGSGGFGGDPGRAPK